MTKDELLRKYHDQECNNLLCYSANYGMTKPRAGYETEHAECLERVKQLEEIIYFMGLMEEAFPVWTDAVESAEELAMADRQHKAHDGIMAVISEAHIEPVLHAGPEKDLDMASKGLLIAINEYSGASFRHLETAQKSYTNRELLDIYLNYEGIIGYTERLLCVMGALGLLTGTR